MATYKQIAEANSNIKTTNLKGKEYAEVFQRINAFRMVYPNGCITTEIVSSKTDDKGNDVILMKATVTDEDGKMLGTGYSYERENSTFVNKTSYIENCETSAVGRALAMCGFGIETSIASLQEVVNAINNQGVAKPAQQAKDDNRITVQKAKEILNNCTTIEQLNTQYKNLPENVRADKTTINFCIAKKAQIQSVNDTNTKER